MILLLCVISLVPLLAIALYNSRHAPRLEDFNLEALPPAEDGLPVSPPAVSLLVPIVDKTASAGLLRALSRIDYPNYEIVFCVDAGDASREAVAAFAAASDGKARLLDYDEAPAGWRRENWAAHRLAQASKKEWLVFCSSELSASPLALSRTMAAALSLKADCLGAMPRRITGSWAERALSPFLRELPVAGLFRLSKQPALPISPEWFAITRAAYQATGGHAVVPQSPVAEGAIAHRARVQFKSYNALATNDLSLRLSRGWRAVWDDSVQRVNLLAGGRETTLFGLLLLHIGAFVLPWLAVLLWAPGALAALLLLIAFRLVASAIFDSPGFDAVAHPLGAVLMPALVIDSYRRARKPAAISFSPAYATDGKDVGTDGV